MEKARFYKILIAILVLLNIGTLSFLWFGRSASQSENQQKESIEPFVRGLQLSQEQIVQFKLFRDDHLTQLYFLRMEDRRLHELFYDALFLPVPDTIKANRIADSLVMVRKKMELLTFSHFQQIQQILNDHQKIKFRTIFRGAVEQVMPPPPPPPPPPLPPPPPPSKGRKLNAEM